MFTTLILLALATSSPGANPQIVVHGTGKVMTPPDVVTISFSLRGESSTSDDAVRNLETNRRSIADAVTELASSQFEDGKMSIDTVRGRSCKTDYDQVVLSTGDCAVQGYVASMDVTLRTTAIKDAATLVGLIGRLHGENPKVSSFDVSDAQAARRSAMAVATKDASASAEALAQAAGKHLGRIISITDASDRSEINDIVVTAQRQMAPPAMVLPPVKVNITPAPIETTASVTVTYELVQSSGLADQPFSVRSARHSRRATGHVNEISL